MIDLGLAKLKGHGPGASREPPSLGPPMAGPGWRLPVGAGLLLALALALHRLSGRWL